MHKPRGNPVLRSDLWPRGPVCTQNFITTNSSDDCIQVAGATPTDKPPQLFSVVEFAFVPRKTSRIVVEIPDWCIKMVTQVARCHIVYPKANWLQVGPCDIIDARAFVVIGDKLYAIGGNISTGRQFMKKGIDLMPLATFRGCGLVVTFTVTPLRDEPEIPGQSSSQLNTQLLTETAPPDIPIQNDDAEMGILAVTLLADPQAMPTLATITGWQDKPVWISNCP